MYEFWNDFIEPVAVALRPAVIVEVGAEAGLNTKNILAYCMAYGARCHVIDPEEIGLVTELLPLLQRYGIFHQGLSLEFLPQIMDGDLYLLDGDHNWYTAYHELQVILKTTFEQQRPLPLIFMHDISWPYHRRDLYYYPDTIPPEFRHPYVKAGLMPGQSETLPDGGFNDGLCNAAHEGGPRNGVLTAIEDFLKEHPGLYHFYSLPGLHGLGLLAPAQGLPEAVTTTIHSIFDIAPRLRTHMEKIEADRMQSYADQGVLAAQHRNAHINFQRIQQDIAQHIEALMTEKTQQIEEIVQARDRQIERIVAERDREIAAIIKDKDAIIAALKQELAARDQQLHHLQDFETKIKGTLPYKLYHYLNPGKQEAQKPRSPEAEKPRSREADELKSQEAKKI